MTPSEIYVLTIIVAFIWLAAGLLGIVVWLDRRADRRYRADMLDDFDTFIKEQRKDNLRHRLRGIRSMIKIGTHSRGPREGQPFTDIEIRRLKNKERELRAQLELLTSHRDSA
jgi:hypothetical protein